MAYETRSIKTKVTMLLGLCPEHRSLQRGTRYNGSPQRSVDMWCDHWRVCELRGAVAGRTGRDPDNMDKLCYVQQLVNLDMAWTFDFVGLPTELPNQICGYLLFLRPSSAH